MPKLRRIVLYPIKSLDGVEVPAAELLATGPLRNDRRYAIYDAAGRLMNGKRTPAVHRIRADFAADASSVELSLKDGGLRSTFELPADNERVAAWLTAALEVPCTLREDAESGFPDDPISSGPTLLSTGTLREVGRWFNLPEDEIRRRFRPNLEVDAGQPFWEDRLFGSPQRPVRFTNGGVRFHGVNPCERCVVPTRDAATGQPLQSFAKRFAQLREEHLPAWADRDAFDHFYRLMINTRLAAGQDGELRIHIGDEIHFHESK